ncbi:MAG TPA: TolC family protein [Gemmatimonadales bacterium]|jgi:outer membrane protein TolC|nr:TolC family protein [Gemmatimonadales bacterium]
MASQKRSRLAVLTLAVLAAAPVGAQSPAPPPLRLSFAEAVRRAAGEAPAVELSGLRTDEAEARVRQARGVLLPTLSITGGWLDRDFNSKTQGISFPGVPTIIGPFTAYDARVRVTQTLLDFSALSRVRAARTQVTGFGAEGSAVSEGAAAGAALAYLRVARAAAQVAARQADSAIALELVGLAQAQKAAGVSAAIDVTRARSQLAQAEGSVLVARNQLDRARIDLARALGLGPEARLEISDSLSATLPGADLPAARDSIVVLALARRPDLRAELARGDAARTARSAIAAERLPRLDLAADYGLSGLTPSLAVGTRQIGVQVTIPILDGFRREGRAAEAAALARESDVRARDLRQQVAADVEGALLDLASSEAQQAIAAERLGLAADELAQARERFAAGVAGNIEVINAQSSLLRARDTDIDARFAAATARVALARAAGVARTLH